MTTLDLSDDRTLADKREAARRLLTGMLKPKVAPFAQHVNPRLAEMLNGMGIDVTFVRGAGTQLFDASGRAYLDFAGAYGALPFGHNPPQIWQAIIGVQASGEPSLIQPSILAAAGELAERLTALAPGDLRYAFFCNSGAEAVEAGIKLARAATARNLVVATRNAFHGKTLGALSATGRQRYQLPFGAPAGGFTHVPFGDVGALQQLFAARGAEIAAFIVEPIQGEGGIVCAPEGYLRAARQLCTEHGALLIIDEVQTGLGRTGSLFACQQHDVEPDIMPLAKALGGGVVPIGAVLFNDAALSEDFLLRHTSTFGGNTFCSRVGLRSLELLTDNQEHLIAHVRDQGRRLKAALIEVAAAHRRVVTDVRGEGLLLGVEVTSDPWQFPVQGLFRSLADQEGLAAFLCGYLLHNEGVRLAPAYFAGDVLRVEPPLTVTQDECDAFVAALDRALSLVTVNDTARFFTFLSGRAPAGPTTTSNAAVPPIAVVTAGEPRWAFLAHPTDHASYERFDTALGLAGDDVRILFDRMNQCRNLDSPAAMFMGACRINADSGATSYGEIYALPYNARQLLDMPAAQATALVQQAAVEAVERGAQVVGLGAYTSIVTSNAQALGGIGVPITTGNAYTVASAVDGLGAAALRSQVEVRDATCAVLGATGAIGRAAALLLSEQVGRLILAGNPRNATSSIRRLQAITSEIIEHLRAHADTVEEPGVLASTVAAALTAGQPPAQLLEHLDREGLLTVSVDTDTAVASAHLVLAATSTPDLLIRAEVPRPGAVICDVSQPPNVGQEIIHARPDLTVVEGGLVELPGGRALHVDLGVPPGVTYACAAETMIIAHRLSDPIVSHGDRLNIDLVRALREDARRLGFRLHLPEPGALRSHP